MRLSAITVAIALLVAAAAATSEDLSVSGKYHIFDAAQVNLASRSVLDLVYLEDPRHPDATIMDTLNSELDIDVRRVCAKVGRKLGVGGFSTVYEVRPFKYNAESRSCDASVEANNYYALKMSSYCSSAEAIQNKDPDSRWIKIDSERLEPKSFDGRFFVNTFGYSVYDRERERRPTPQERQTMKEYCLGILMEQGESKLLPGIASMDSVTHEDIATLLFGVASAMLSMDVHGKFNCDIKSDNVLLFKHEGRYISKMSDLTNHFLIETPEGDRREYAEEVAVCPSTCTKKEVCASFGTYMIRSPWWIDRLLRDSSEIKRGCANPHVENMWSLLTMAIQILQFKDRQGRTLGDKFPRAFGNFNRKHFLGDFSMPFNSLTVRDIHGAKAKVQKIGQYYMDLVGDMKTIDSRKNKVFDEKKIKENDNWNLLKDFMKMLVTGAESGAVINDVLNHPYLGLRTVRMDDYDNFFDASRESFLSDRSQLA